MRTNIVEIRFLAKDSLNALPSIVNSLGYFDLIYRDSKIEQLDDFIKVTLVCRATFDMNELSLRRFMEKMPIIDEVMSIFQSKVLTNKPKVFFKLYVNDEITHDILHFAETRLSESYGPVTGLLLRSAAKKSNNVGSLFLNLAKHLNEKQKRKFLENIQDLSELRPLHESMTREK